MNQQAFGANALNVEQLPLEDAFREMEVGPPPAAVAPVPAAPVPMVLGPRVLNAEELQQFIVLNSEQNKLLKTFDKDNQQFKCSARGQPVRTKIFDGILERNLHALKIDDLRIAQRLMFKCFWNLNENLIFETGIASGKTTAYVIWLIDTVIELRGENPVEPQDPRSPMSIVLIPTRELGLQIYKLFQALIQETGVSVSFFTEIKPTETFQEETVMSDIVIVTPVHAKILMSSGKLSVANLKNVVLDETDYMVRKFPEVTEVIQDIKETRRAVQLVAVTSTSSYDLRTFLDRNFGAVGRGTTRLWAEGRAFLSARVTFVAVYTSNWTDKRIALLDTIKRKTQTLVFMSTAVGCDNLVKQLNHPNNSTVAAAITSRTPPDEVEGHLANFERKGLKVIVTTDDFCRGLNFLGVEDVISFDIPSSSLEVKLRHRIGRIGRTTDGTAVVYFEKHSTEHEKKLRFRRVLVEEKQDLDGPMRRWEPSLGSVLDYVPRRPPRIWIRYQQPSKLNLCPLVIAFFFLSFLIFSNVYVSIAF